MTNLATNATSHMIVVQGYQNNHPIELLIPYFFLAVIVGLIIFAFWFFWTKNKDSQ
jgi:hypothetical protein